MSTFNLLTFPIFTAGLLHGLNQRQSPSFQPDPKAQYKIIGIGMGLSVMKALDIYFKERPIVKSSFAAHFVGGGLIGGGFIIGATYCLGLHLTKIPSKTVFD
jgi:hypothetical protein